MLSSVSEVDPLSFRSLFRQSGGSGAGLGPLVNFYSKLPKGPATARVSGIKGRYFAGSAASGKPIVALIVGLFAIGYTIDYNSPSSFSISLLEIFTHIPFAVHLSMCISIFVSGR